MHTADRAPHDAQVKPILFARPEEEHIFGYSLPKDPENARERECESCIRSYPRYSLASRSNLSSTTLHLAVTMMWKEHTPSPGLAGAGGQPVPDFKAMNKDAAKR